MVRTMIQNYAPVPAKKQSTNCLLLKVAKVQFHPDKVQPHPHEPTTKKRKYRNQ